MHNLIVYPPGTSFLPFMKLLECFITEFIVFIFQVAMDIVTRFFVSDSCDIHLNHGDLLDGIWSWVGIKPENRQKVAEVFLMYLRDALEYEKYGLTDAFSP